MKVVLTSGFSDSYLRLAEGVAKFHDNPNVSILRKPFRRDELVDLLTRPDRGLTRTRLRRAARARPRTVDLARVGVNPAVVHRLFGDPVELFRLHPDIAQRARQAEVGDQCGHRVAGRLARPAQRLADPGLAFGVHRLVEAQHVRQHDAGGVAVRHVRGAAQHVADAVAGALRARRSASP